MTNLRNDACRRLGLVFALSLLAVGISVNIGCVSDAAKRFQAHIDYLADDDRDGRGLGTEGIEEAAEYIAREFAQLGLAPGGENGSYFQVFPMPLSRRLTEAGSFSFTGDTVARQQGRDYVPLAISSEGTFSGEIVFCGYGIVSEKMALDDFAGIDVKGKVVIILRGMPSAWDEKEINPRHAMLTHKVYNAKDLGAAGVLFVNHAAPGKGRDELLEFDTGAAGNFGLPAVHITRATANAMLARVPAMKAHGVGTVDALQAALDKGQSASATLLGVEARGEIIFEQETVSTRNVLGMLKGQGSLADEYIVIGAHYDHLGIKRPMMRSFKDGKIVRTRTSPQIHNGADDNASGTSGIIEIARLFTEQAQPPNRSILFMAFSAEETGLHGSRHFVENPTVPHDKIIAMLNLDMIGRLKPGTREVQVFGMTTSPAFDPILQRAGRVAGLSILSSGDAGGRSDHAPFVRSGIPSLHYFTGTHSDYHKPTDDSYKINARGGAKVISLVYETAAALAARDQRPVFKAPVAKKKKEGGGGTPTFRVVMGLAPRYGEGGIKGMGVDAVTPDGPADLGGMKAGDTIIRIAGKPIANVYDYMAATRNNKSGDVVQVVVVRKGKEVTLTVTLAAAG